MTENEMTNDENNEAGTPAAAFLSRRVMPAGVPTAGLSATPPTTVSAGWASDGPRQPEADTGHDYTMPTPHAKTAEQFCSGVMGPATLSVAVSRLAVDRATDADTRQFANFELREAIAVTGILKDLNTPVPPMSAEGQALLTNLETAGNGAQFDKTYMAAQLANHEFLRDLADSYLANEVGADGSEERHGHHLAALAITAFKEHVVLAKNILGALGA